MVRTDHGKRLSAGADGKYFGRLPLSAATNSMYRPDGTNARLPGTVAAVPSL
ncbi:hypothetical protein ACFVT1_25470 [Streptomyces sp. NPDC057963]|uniref:hypothetical protein n=1 Tax=Streptomyces sp. NPDC057963 TaxID=3346290 RepID=UPI0036E3EFA0